MSARLLDSNKELS